MVVSVHELVDPDAELVEVREGVPVVVLVLEDAPKRFRGGVVVGLSAFLCKDLTWVMVSHLVKATREHDVELVQGHLPVVV